MRKHYERKFLNRGEGLAAIETSIDSYKGDSIDGYVSIADCNRKVTLDFYVGKRGGGKGAIKKIDDLIGALQRFRAGMVNEIAAREGGAE